MTNYKGVARCKMIDNTNGEGLIPDIIDKCTWKVGPHGLNAPTPDPSAPECTLEFTTNGDRLAELEAHGGIIYLFEYVAEDIT
jgi:hypothetical protein